ncbi:hypothetical protein ICW40_03210 [Actinotalea ferrariae]|uniref:hypothetical protein n=1 Tax=Actinotalea ferrariae TaxID=1386098 RepID=UPI001C8CBB0D|nr:hypothetical protein [Actinotalea ferrariae]MBX9243814.1 hypothetical protein [Actinotalea ferrariae]
MLRTLLDQIDVDGWQSPAGTALLTYIRETLVRPLTVDLGMRGAASGQAETSAWEDVWEVLNSPALRTADSPWGLIWSVARHAILTEAVCARYPTSPRKAWQLAKVHAGGLVQPVIRLDDLPHAQMPCAAQDGTRPRITDAADAAVDALVAAGWPEDRAAEIVEDVLADTPTTRSTRWTGRAHGWTSYGWRNMAERLSLPAWQARRLVIVLRGSAENPGLLPRLLLAGGTVEIDPELRAALRSTRMRSHPSPVLPTPGTELIAAMRDRAS